MFAAGNFLIPDATLIVELLVFAVVAGVIARFVVPPLNKAMRQRSDEIEASLDKARQADALLLTTQADYDARLDEARGEARAITDGARRVAEYLREEGRKQGKEEYDRLIKRARSDIARERAVAQERR